MRIDEALNLEILITGFKIRDSKYNDKASGNTKYLSLQIELDGIKYVVFTGSKILSDQIEKYKDKIPFLAKIIKIDRYYSLS